MFDQNNNPTGAAPANVPAQGGLTPPSSSKIGMDDINDGKQYPFKKVGPPAVDKPDTAEDIFEDSGDNPKPASNIIRPLGQEQPVQQQAPQKPQIKPDGPVQADMPPGIQPMKPHKKSKVLTVIIIVLVAVVLGLAAYWASGALLNRNNDNGFNDLIIPQNDQGNINDILNDLNDELDQEQDTPSDPNNEGSYNEFEDPDEEKPPFTDDEPETQEPAIDTDQDGLTDDEELSWGTNPSRVDTDFDGLSDYEEVNIYATSPVNADSDNDSYLDGVEVENGFDPLGPGMLQ